MIKFQNLGGGQMKICESVKNVKIIGFLTFYLDILHKLKGNLDLGQEHVKRGTLSIQGKNWNNFPCYPWKNDSFPVLSLLIHPSLPKIWLPHLHKNYIFEISDIRAIL